MSARKILGVLLLVTLVTVEKAPTAWSQYPVQEQEVQIHETGLTLLGLQNAPLIPSDWAYTVVDSVGSSTAHSTVSLDKDGVAHVAYFSGGSIMHGYKDGSTWHPPLPVGPADIPWQKELWATAFDNDGMLHIAYQSPGDSAFKHVRQTASGWSSEQVDGETNVEHVSLVLDVDDYPHVVYGKADDISHLMYTHEDGVGWWNPETLFDDDSPGSSISMAVDAGGVAHFSYSLVADYSLWYAKRLGTDSFGWLLLDPDLEASGQSDLALSSGGYPHVCYYGYYDDPTYGTTLAFKYMFRDHTGWHGPYLVDEFVSQAVPAQCSVALDGSDFVHMLYQDDGALYHYYQDEEGWWQSTVASQGSGGEAAGQFNSLAVDWDGRPYISYYYEGDGGKLILAVGDRQPPELIGNTDCIWGHSDCNRCVHNLEDTFNSLRERPDIMGFHLGDHPDPGWGLGTLFRQHFQGIQRLSSGEGQYMAISQDKIEYEGKDWSGFAIVKMASRDTGGARYRSNRLSPTAHVNDTAPLPQDRIVKTVHTSNDWDHAGGLQALGDLLAIGIEGDVDNGVPSEVHFYSLSDPENPEHIGDLDVADSTATAVALSQLQDRRYLLVVSSTYGSELKFFVSRMPYNYWAWDYLDEWDRDADDTPWETYQNVNLLTDCETGHLYLIAMHNNCTGLCNPPWGEDWADLFRVWLEDDTQQVKLEKVANHHAFCSHYGEWQCNFRAATGAYVDPSGSLILYSTMFQNNGPQGDEPAPSIKAAEFRPLPHGTCDTIQDAWVELFDHTNFHGGSLMVDYVDTEEYPGHDATCYEEYTTYNEYLVDWNREVGLDDQVSSAIWCLPVGWAYEIYDHDLGYCSGKLLTLYGLGKPLQIDDLKKWGVGDQASCSHYSQDPPVRAGVHPVTGATLYYIATKPAGLALSAAPLSAGQEDPLTIVDVPPYAVEQEIDLIYAPTLPSAPPEDPLGYAGRAFRLDVEVDGEVQVGYSFSKPVEVTIHYRPDDMGSTDEGSLMLYAWDADGSQWVDAGTTCDPASVSDRDAGRDWLSTSICRTGEFAVFGTAMPRRVLFDEAHDSLRTLDWSRAQQLADAWEAEPEWMHLGELEDRLSDEFSLERNASAPLTANLLQDYDALMIALNQEALTATEVQAIKQYVANGGGLIALGDCGYLDPNPELVSSYGITLVQDCLFAPAPEMNATVAISDVADHAAIGDALGYTHHWGQSLNVSDDAVPIADTTGVGAWRDTNGNDAYEEGEEGVFTVSAVYDSGCGRVVAIGDATFADADLDWTDNDVLMRALLRWVTGGSPCGAGGDNLVYLPLVLRNR